MRRLARKAVYRFAPPEMIAALEYRRTVLSKRPGAFPARNMVVVDEAPTGSVLIMAPHPDDEVIGPGGTLALHLKKKDPVTVLYLTDGRGGILSDKTLVPIRRQEAKTIGEAYDFNQIFWDIPDTHLNSDPETVGRLEKVLVEIRPNFIYLTSFFDRQHDHFAANHLLADTLRRMGNTAVAIFGYEVWDNISYPNYIVDISDSFEDKATMMRRYKTPMAATDFVELFRHRNALHYSLFVDSRRRETEGYAEAFYRLDGAQFTTLFDTYAETLQALHSPMQPAIK